MRIYIIDGQGGGIGKYLIQRIRKELESNIYILAMGTNALATAAMLKAGANQGVSGENAIVYNCTNTDVDFIIGCVSIMFPNAMLGELTPNIAQAVGLSSGKKILLPLSQEKVILAGCSKEPLPHLVDEVIKEIKEFMGGKESV